LELNQHHVCISFFVIFFKKKKLIFLFFSFFFPSKKIAELQTVLKHANGNPLFIEEIGSGLIESGVFEIRDQQCVIAKQGKLTIPHTLNGVISSRLDRLDPVLQMVLKVGLYNFFNFLIFFFEKSID
jgi:hypothetical protein